MFIQEIRLNTRRITGLENSSLFALQKASKIDLSWQPSVALEICNFLSLCFLACPRSEIHWFDTAFERSRWRGGATPHNGQ
jgi:hypothetical protein